MQFCCDTPIAVAPFVTLVDFMNLSLQSGILVAPLLKLGLIVKRAARELGDLEQCRQ